MSEALLSLEEWRERIGYHPWHYWGLSSSARFPVSSQCNDIVFQYPWLTADAAGRDDINRAIISAEERLMPLLGFAPAPHYKEVTLQFPRYPQQDLMRLGYSAADDRWLTLQLPEGKVQHLGYKSETLIGSAAVVLSDVDGDGLNDTFTITLATTVTNEDYIRVYFDSGDRFTGDDISDRWRVRPVKISIAGGSVTVKGDIRLIVRPILYENQTAPIDPSDATNFADDLDIYDYHIDNTGITEDDCQCVLIWETTPYPCWAYPSSNSYDPAAVGYALARAVIRDSEPGLIGIGQSVYNATSGQWVGVDWCGCYYNWRPPDRVLVRYEAGAPRADHDRMDMRYANMVARLATAEMARRICACDIANRNLSYWQYDLAQSSGNAGEAYGLISREDLMNPLGTRRGQVMTWKEVKINRKIQGFVP